MTLGLKPLRLIPVPQGQSIVTARSEVVCSAVLGSCIAICLHDPVREMGGMAHFLLPGTDPAGTSSISYGTHAIESLLDTMGYTGMRHLKLDVSLIGGADLVPGMRRFGEANSRFANDILREKGLAAGFIDVGGAAGRRIRFSPSTGVLNVRMVDQNGRHDTPKATACPENRLMP